MQLRFYSLFGLMALFNIGVCGAPKANASPALCKDLFARSPHKIPPARALAPEQINYRLIPSQTQNPNAPVIVLVHGLGSSMATWAKVIPELTKKFRVLVYDQRGHGKTPALGENYTTSVMANDLNVLLEHLGISKVAIIGHSLGARTSLKFLELHPDKVESLVLEDMDARQVYGTEPEKIAKHLQLARGHMSLKPYYDNPREFLRDLLPIFGGDFERAERGAGRFVEGVDKETGRIYIRTPVSTLYGYQGNIDNFGPTLERAAQPILFIRANSEKSPFFPNVGVNHILNHGRNVLIEEISEAGHTIHEKETLAPYLDIVKEFLATRTIARERRNRHSTRIQESDRNRYNTLVPPDSRIHLEE